MSKKEFNDSQLEAINASIEKDILVSAAAGSGKTKTLSSKVFKIINEGLIAPSELLVLTFTKNAAHEMKSRIIKTFIDKKKFDLANEMKSCHIQTFDSFSLELVKKHSGRLNIADTISIVKDDIIRLKRLSLLDEVLNEYYLNEFERITNLLKKYNSRDDEITKKVIIDLAANLDKLPLSKKEEFINNYEANYLSVDKFHDYMEKYINYYKGIMIDKILEAYINEDSGFAFVKTKGLYKSGNIQTIIDYLKDTDNFKLDYKDLRFKDDSIQDLYKLYLRVLDMNPYEFLEFAHNLDSYDELNNLPKDAKSKANYKALRKLFVAERQDWNPTFKELIDLKDINELYEEFYEQKEDIYFLFEIIKKVDMRLEDYKKISGSFTYNDISKFTYELLTKEEFSDIQEDLRNQFKYIMVDEYQDSNDYQESLIDSLLKLSEKGRRSHLFCVGDVKQSIYAFRNSKVELFRNRQARYSSDDPDNLVINMNYSYRSGEGLINDINYLFESYMRLDNGKIDYSIDSEKLHYDKEIDLYGLPYDNFKVERLLDKFDSSKIKEAKAIISDIKDKVENHYQVYEKGKGLRDCKYSDFCIIVRNKKGFMMYQKLFYENNIPLNVRLSDVITEIDPVITLQSIFSIINYFVNKADNVDIRHLFASLARNYIYEYNDEHLHEILLDNTNEAIFNDKIMLDIKEFIKENKDNQFDTIFLNAINYFNIINKANLIGDLIDSVNKIESLYSLVLNQRENGEGLAEFVELFKIISKNKIDISGETNINNDNAVDMMTIHASKGLERKIVYLPTSFNKAGRDINKSDYLFSKEFGVILKNYLNEADCDTILHKFHSTILDEKQEDKDEYVRLLYVAFTRAENTCIIVGNKYEGLYDVYGSLPFYYETDEELLDELDVHVHTLVDAYNDSINLIKNGYALVDKDVSELNEYQLKFRKSILDCFLSTINDNHKQLALAISSSVVLIYKDILDKADNKEDLMAKMYGFKLGYNVDTFDELLGRIGELRDLEALDEEDDEIIDITSEDDLKEAIKAFMNSLYDSDLINGRYFLYAFKDIKFFMERNYSINGFIDYKRYAIMDNLSKNSSKPICNINYEINDDDINFDPIKTFRASIKIATDEEKEIKEKLDYGTYLHHLLELIDFKTKDTSYIKDKKAKELIDKTLKLEIFNNLDNATIYKEYEYYDDLYDTVGSIDLLYIKDGIYYIIDYKSSDIDKEGYINQLYTYQRNVMEKFNIKSDSIKLYLVSISKQSFMEVNAYKE